MQDAILAAATQYAELHGEMSALDVLGEMKKGNEIILRSVLALLEHIA